MEDRRILLSFIDGLNDGETSQYAQDTDQALYYICGAQKLVELHKVTVQWFYTVDEPLPWLVRLEQP